MPVPSVDAVAPLPAKVVTVPPDVTFLSVFVPASTTYTLPAGSTVIPLRKPLKPDARVVTTPARVILRIVPPPRSDA